jgi:hypothetical protein
MSSATLGIWNSILQIVLLLRESMRLAAALTEVGSSPGRATASAGDSLIIETHLPIGRLEQPTPLAVQHVGVVLSTVVRRIYYRSQRNADLDGRHP